MSKLIICRSVISSTIQATLWPTLLRTDTAASRFVQRDVLFLSNLLTAGSLLLLIASIITPLGLNDTIKKDTSAYVNFEYAQDLSAWGFATSPRPIMPFSRHCDNQACPGSSELPMHMNRSTYDLHIPENLTRIFSSGTLNNRTVSGLFDMQYRLWNTAINFDARKPEPYPVGVYRSVDSIFSHNTTKIVEGLVVDTVNGGIGFRNHSIPTGLRNGATWSEDLTWIEPVTECVDTNLSYKVVLNLSDFREQGSLVDKGGFAHLAKDEPHQGRWNDGQDLDLKARAYRAAWHNNVLSMIHFNLTVNGSPWDRPGGVDSHVGKEFGTYNLTIAANDRVRNERLSELLSGMHRIEISALYGKHLGLHREGPISADMFDEAVLKLEETLSFRPDLKGNPFKFLGKWLQTDFLFVRKAHFKPETVCQGIGGYDRAEKLAPHVHCSSLRGIPNWRSVGDPAARHLVSQWERPLYICASGIRASVKKVDFSFNGTSDLENLRVARIEDKIYSDDNAKPLWAVERTGLNVTRANPLWGIVSDEFADAQGVWTYRAEKLWLPAVDKRRNIYEAGDSVAGANAPAGALVSTIEDSTSQSTFARRSLGDFSGSTYVMFRLWQQLSQEASTAPQVIDLIVTNLLASAMVGTKSLVSPAATTSSASSAQWTVLKHVKIVTYNYVYGIPAIIFLALWLSALIIALMSWFRFKLSIDRMRQLLNRTSVGRVVTTIAYPELCDPVAPTSEWVATAGFKNVDLSELSSIGKKRPRSMFDEVDDRSDIALVSRSVSRSVSLREFPFSKRHCS